jgi:hypothetical protein
MEFNLPVLPTGATVVDAYLDVDLLSVSGELGVSNWGSYAGGTGDITGSGNDGTYGVYDPPTGAISINVTGAVLSDYAQSYATGAWAFAAMVDNGAWYSIAGVDSVNGFAPHLVLDTEGGEIPEPNSLLSIATGLGGLALVALRRRRR